ncbi:MAG: hypothetical protein ABSB91_03760 [Sedimentisphaerales bacterium]
MPREKEQILFEWSEPKEFTIQSARSYNKLGITALPRGIIIITILLTILYFVFNYLFPPDLNFNLFKPFLLVWLCGIGLLVFGYFFLPWLLVFQRTRYRITNKRIRTVSGNHSNMTKWQNLKGYVLSESQTLPGHKDIILLAYDHPKTIHLPNDNSTDQIIQCIAERLPVFQSVPDAIKPVPLTFMQKTSYVICTLIYSVGLTFFIVFNKSLRSFTNKFDFMPELFLIFVFIFGPGTICSLLLFGRSLFKNKNIKINSFICNLVSIGLIIPLFFIFSLWKLKRFGGW